MTTKLTLDLNEQIVEKAKRIAREQGQSLSDLIEALLSEIPEPKNSTVEKIKAKDPERVKRILAGTESVPENLKAFFSPKEKLNTEQTILEDSELSEDKKTLIAELMKKYG